MNNVTEHIFIMNSTGFKPSLTTQKVTDIPGGPLQGNLENVLDFSKVCRTCATVTELVVPIFDGEGLHNNLAEKIHKYLPIQITQQDVLPHVVCYQCASTLLAWHELVNCCVQADAALRTRMPVTHDAKQQPPKLKPETSQNATKTEQNKFKKGPTSVGQAVRPPQYVGRSTNPAPERTKTCCFCKSKLPERVYNDHLIGAHAELMFHCEECDTYVDRKQFIRHMAVHAAQYAKPEKNSIPEIIRKLIRKRVELSKMPKFSKTPPEPPPASSAPVAADPKKDKEANEFSDQSDIESGFGPLPESVFEAMEDSQDQPTDAAVKQPPPTADVTDTKDKLKSPKLFRTCQICFKGYTAPSSYFYHMKHAHGKNKDHECEICGKKFATKANLVEHGSIHTGELKFECKLCNKRFRAKASLYIHSQTHAGVARHACGWCGRRFRWRTHLARHVTRHATARPHACDTCGRAFSVRCDLLRHQRTHDAQRHTCTHCGLHFAQLRYLKVHLRRKHSDLDKLSDTNN